MLGGFRFGRQGDMEDACANLMTRAYNGVHDSFLRMFQKVFGEVVADSS